MMVEFQVLDVDSSVTRLTKLILSHCVPPESRPAVSCPDMPIRRIYVNHYLTFLEDSTYV